MQPLQIFSILVLLFVYSCAHAAPLKNTMKENASPYLAMHSDDPVAWQPWNEETLAMAKRQNKLLFVSVGYFSCHWCHVMQRESFSDIDIALKLNADFIPVKVDRELNAALDAHLIEFVQRTRGFAGWPLNVFVTPEGYPVLGLVYLPKQDFNKLVDQVRNLWRDEQTYLITMARQAAEQIKNEKTINRRSLQKDTGSEWLAGFVRQALELSDEMSGGFGDQSKFPMARQLKLLIEAHIGKPSNDIAQFVQLTLNHMATQGLRDHLGGGFFRYTVDPTWQTPHFEKMLYDNAELALVFIQAGEVFKREDYIAVARETLDFMLRELLTDDGAMMASLSAVDDKGEEGGYYLWDETLLARHLSVDELQVIKLLWNMQDKPAFEAGYLPRQAQSPDHVAKQLNMKVGEVLKLIADAQGKLLKQRASRSLPKDNKQLASWNGLALSALVAGARLPNGEKYRDAAGRLRSYIVHTLWNGEQLARAKHNKQQVGRAGLEDYAFAARGLIDWAQLVDDQKDRLLARQWLNTAWQRFYKTNGWQLTDQLLLPFDFGESVMRDGALPSATAVLIRATLELTRQDKKSELKQRAQNALELGADIVEKEPFYFSSHVALVHDYLAGEFDPAANKLLK